MNTLAMAAHWLLSLRVRLLWRQHEFTILWRDCFRERLILSTSWGHRGARFGWERCVTDVTHWLSVSWSNPRVHCWWACTVTLYLRSPRYHLSHWGRSSWQHTFLQRLWCWAWYWERPGERWDWLIRSSWAPTRISARLWWRVTVGWPQARDRLVRRWAYRVDRVSLWLRPWPVHIAFHGYCCDTGPYTWHTRFTWGRVHGWRWPGFQAWQETSYDAMDGMSDGPTDYSVVAARDAGEFTPTRCAACGAGNAPYMEGQYTFCLQCIGAERAAAEGEYEPYAHEYQ